MGLFDSFRSTSSAAGEFKKIFINAMQFFIDVSFEPFKYPMATVNVKKQAYMTEMAEFCRYKVADPKKEHFNIYTNGENMIMRLNMSTALVVAQREIEALENGEKLSKSKVEYIIDDVQHNCTMFDYNCVLSRYS